MPVRFEIEVELGGAVYFYGVVFDFPPDFKELRVLEEKFMVDGRPVYTRQLAQVYLSRTGQEKEARFEIDWYFVALPVIQEHSGNDPIAVLKQWLARMLILRPTPSLIQGDSKDETLQPNLEVTNFAAWFAGLLTHAPSAYTGLIDISSN